MDSMEKFAADMSRLLEIAERIDAKLGAGSAATLSRAFTPSAPAGDLKPAPDSDLDGQYGNPVIKSDPKRWTGPSYVGKRWSETTPEYLDAVIGLALWKLGKDQAAGDEKKAGYARRDAERALGWRLRLEAGYKPPAPVDDDCPF
jgi:hypothetical protein